MTEELLRFREVEVGEWFRLVKDPEGDEHEGDEFIKVNSTEAVRTWEGAPRVSFDDTCTVIAVQPEIVEAS